jgi:hypothetical protein
MSAAAPVDLGLSMIAYETERNFSTVREGGIAGGRYCMLAHKSGGHTDKDWICSLTWRSKNLTNWI